MKKLQNYRSFTIFENLLALFILSVLLINSLNLLTIKYDSFYNKLVNAQNLYIKDNIVDSSIGLK